MKYKGAEAGGLGSSVMFVNGLENLADALQENGGHYVVNISSATDISTYISALTVYANNKMIEGNTIIITFVKSASCNLVIPASSAGVMLLWTQCSASLSSSIRNISSSVTLSNYAGCTMAFNPTDGRWHINMTY